MTRTGTVRKPRRRVVIAALALLLFLPFAFLGLFELALAFAGVKPLALTEDSHFGFDAAPPLFVPKRVPGGTDSLVTNPAHLTHFNYQSFPARKEPGTFRIFALGGSTTFGHPWRDRTSFSAWLRELLPEADPSRRYEVINVGGVSYASYRVARLVEELAAYEPDLLIVYNGHNEFLEERTYRDFRARAAWIRRLSGALNHTRTYSLLRRALGTDAGPRARLSGGVRDVLAETIGPETYTRNDALRRAVLEHYRESQKRVAGLAASVGARTIFVTTPVNEEHCSPFKSEPTPGLSPTDSARVAAWMREAALLLAARPTDAARLLDSAARLDPRNAEVLFRAGTAAMAAGRHAEAKEYFVRAVDEDVCPLRALPEMRAIEREVAQETRSGFVDYLGALEAASTARKGHNVLGEPDFVDHVHMSIANYGHLAAEIVAEMARMGLPGRAGGPDPEAFARAGKTIFSRLDAEEEALGFHNIAKVLNWAGKREDAVRAARRGLALDTTSLESIWSTLFVATDLERQGRDAEAMRLYRRALRIDPENAETLRLLGDAQLRTGDSAAGETNLEQAALRAADDPRVLERAWRVAYARKRFPDAIRHLRQLSALGAADAEARMMLAGAYMSTGNPRGAEGELRILTAEHPDFPQGWMALGFALEAQGRTGEAMRAYTAALQLDPGLGPARAGLERLR